LLLKTSELRFVNVRLEHLYGLGDDPSSFVTYIIRQCLANAESVELTRGEQIRDFIFIDDAVSGIMQLLISREILPVGRSEIDLGNGNPVSIRQLVERIHQLTKSRSHLCFGRIPYRENESMESKADISKLIELGWNSRTSLDEGLAKTIAFEKIKLIVEAH
jgi:nucleoside-diphosphate-sugar epimerase